MHALPSCLLQILSWYPRLVVFPSFVDKARCEHIIKLASQHLYPSGLAYKPGEAGDPEQETRTSHGTFLSTGQDSAGVLAWVEERIAAATHLPRSNGEVIPPTPMYPGSPCTWRDVHNLTACGVCIITRRAPPPPPLPLPCMLQAFNVLRYENTQHYDSHYDTFDPKEFGQQYSQRIATVLVYLSDVEEGGETVFKREGKAGEYTSLHTHPCLHAGPSCLHSHPQPAIHMSPSRQALPPLVHLIHTLPSPPSSLPAPPPRPSAHPDAHNDMHGFLHACRRQP